jgi:hypothetical protein
MNSHHHVDQLVDDYLHELLSPDEVERVEQHCAECAACRDSLEAARSRLAALRAVPPCEASEELLRKTLERLQFAPRDPKALLQEKERAMKPTSQPPTARQRSPWHRRIWLTLAATAAIAAGVIGLVQSRYQAWQPSPYDLRILGQNQLLQGAPATMRVALVNHQTGQYVDGVKVRLLVKQRSTQQLVEEHELTTAATPITVHLNRPPFDFDRPLNPKSEDEGEYDVSLEANTDRGVERLHQTITVHRKVKLMLSCDKPVYQPGHTIHMRSLSLRRPDLKPVEGEPATFSVVDPHGNVIFKKTQSTSTFGIAAADCELAREILEGTYQLRCDVAGEMSERSVEVQNYVLPKFKVGLTLDKPFYQPKEMINGTLDAAYFYGQPVANGEVLLQLVSSDAETQVLDQQENQTDSEGKLKFEFQLPDHLVGQEQHGGDAQVRVIAQVTDSAGQSQATMVARNVTSQPIHLSVIPEAGRIVPGVKNKLYVFATYPDGQPVKGKITLEGQKQTVETNELGVAAFDLAPVQPNTKFVVEVSAQDDAGHAIRISLALVTGTTSSDYILRSDKPIYNAGDTLHLEALGGGGQEPVFVDLLKDGQSLLSQTIEMKDGRGEAAIDLPAEIAGTIELWSYRFGASGIAERKSRLLLIKPAAELKITAALDREEHRPGERAQMNFRVTDADGKPAPGALSVAVVDEAVFSVLSQSAGLPQLFFTLDQELLKPVYAVYEQWSPGMRSDVPVDVREMFDDAMFSLTARATSGLDQSLRTFSQGETDAKPIDAFGGGVPMPMMMEPEPMGGPMPLDFNAPPLPNPLNLTAASYQGKAQYVASEREKALKNTRIAWGGLIVAVFLGSLSALAIYAPRVFLIGSAIIGVLSVFACGGLFALTFFIGAEKVTSLAKGARDEMMPMMAMAGMPLGEEPMFMAPMAMEGADMNGMLGGLGGGPAEPIRVRKEFPETLLWLPELVTDDDGKVTLDIPLADSITTWRLSAAAVSGTGQLGSGEFPIKVFQPFFVDFNLPVALTRNDEVAIPVVVYNYLDGPQTVNLQLQTASWFQLLGDEPNSELKIELKPREIKSLAIKLKVLEVGRQQLEITAKSGVIGDAVRREIEVVPDGRRIDESFAGRIEGRVDHALEIPAERIPGSTRLIAKVYPATFTQLVEGLDAIFQMPYGCFEQTSSTTYPSVLALDYLKRTKKSSPAVEAKARQYIHIGYQRLVSFEVPGGGFDWFGQPPANRTLTAYGLLEFEDMARVHNVDPSLLDRTRNWLLSQRRPDGTWEGEPHMLDDGLAGAVNRGGDATLASTAYIAWAVFRGGRAADQIGSTLDYLTKQDANKIEDPYVLAIAANAIAAINPEHPALKTYCERLEALKQRDNGKKHTWWEKPGGSETMFHGNGDSAQVETTAMVALALMAAKQHKGSVEEALAWLTTKKGEGGTWGSTQATVLALQALIRGMDQASDTKERKLELAINGERVQEVTIAPDQFDVVQQFDLTKYVEGRGVRGEGAEGEAEPDRVTISLSDKSDTAPAYQLSLWYHVPGEPEMAPPEPLEIKIAYDREQLKVNDHIAATATVTNKLDRVAPMVILDLPIPGGFVMEPDELQELVGSGLIEKFQITPRKTIVYLRDLPPGETLELAYRLKATMPVKVTVPRGEAYQYYTPERKGREKEERVIVVSDA